MIEGVAALLSLLAAILPPLIAMLVDRHQQKGREHDAMVDRSIDELDVGVNRLPK